MEDHRLHFDSVTMAANTGTPGQETSLCLMPLIRRERSQTIPNSNEGFRPCILCRGRVLRLQCQDTQESTPKPSMVEKHMPRAQDIALPSVKSAASERFERAEKSRALSLGRVPSHSRRTTKSSKSEKRRSIEIDSTKAMVNP